MEILFTFVTGFFCGVVSVMAYGWYQVNKIKKIKEALMSQIKIKAAEIDQKKESIKERLLKASDIAQTQLAIRAQLDMPSKNALHSKHKNGLVAELQDLEQQKLDLLKTILAEGYNPMINVMNDNGTTEVPLSSYVDEAIRNLDASMGNTPPPVPGDPNQPKKAGKFILYKGGKDDGTTH